MYYNILITRDMTVYKRSDINDLFTYYIHRHGIQSRVRMHVICAGGSWWMT